MAEMLAVSQSSLLRFSQLRPRASFLPTPHITRPLISHQNQISSLKIKAGVTSDFTVPTTIMANSAAEKIEIIPDSGGGGGDFGGPGGNSGGGGGGDGGNEGKGGSDPNEGDNSKINKGMSMSQKLTLGYLALVGFGGVMGYLKSGSKKSLLAGGISAGLLYFVYTQLPTNTVFASSIGVGISAALLVVMGSRFKKSGKLFPAGIVSFVSFIMTGGYVHGIMRGMH